MKTGTAGGRWSHWRGSTARSWPCRSSCRPPGWRRTGPSCAAPWWPRTWPSGAPGWWPGTAGTSWTASEAAAATSPRTCKGTDTRDELNSSPELICWSGSASTGDISDQSSVFGEVSTHPSPRPNPNPNPAPTQTLDLTQGRVGTSPETWIDPIFRTIAIYFQPELGPALPLDRLIAGLTCSWRCCLRSPRWTSCGSSSRRCSRSAGTAAFPPPAPGPPPGTPAVGTAPASVRFTHTCLYNSKICGLTKMNRKQSRTSHLRKREKRDGSTREG